MAAALISVFWWGIGGGSAGGESLLPEYNNTVGVIDVFILLVWMQESVRDFFFSFILLVEQKEKLTVCTQL